MADPTVNQVSATNQNITKPLEKEQQPKKQQTKSIFMEEHYAGGMQLAPYIATGSAISLFTGGASIFSSMLLKDTIKNPKILSVMKNLPVVGKAMAIAGIVGLVSAFILDNANASKISKVNTTVEKMTPKPIIIDIVQK